MCYELRLFKGWATKKGQQPTDERHAPERSLPTKPVTHTAPDRAPARRKEAERELEETV